MVSRIGCYLRTHRKRRGLTQEELAFIIGCKAVCISRIENGTRRPTLRLVVACHILFGEPINKLFPAFYAEVEDRVMRGAARSYEELIEDGSYIGRIKIELLTDLLIRSKARHS